MTHNYTDYISVGSLMVRPIDPSSKLSHDPVGEGLFDTRHDFLVYTRMTHVAAMLSLINDTVLTSFPSDIKARIMVKLVDTVTDTVVASRCVAVKLSAGMLFTNVRADIPFTFAEVDSSHAYKVTVHVNGRENSLVEHVIHFFNLNEIRRLPTKWFDVESGYVTADHPWNDTPLRNPGFGEWSDAAVTFTLKSNLDFDFAFVPELGVRLVYPTGKEVIELVTPERVDGGWWRVVLPFSVMTPLRGVYYAELRCMGHAFAGMLFSTEVEAEEGLWSGESLVRIPEYTPFRGAHFFKKRQGDGVVKEVPAVDLRCAERVMLDGLTGLVRVKRKLIEYESLVQFSRKRADAGLPLLPLSLHSMFLGSPGTGKTTVAKIMGKLLQHAGILSKGHVVVRERSTLIGKYYNSEAENVTKALEEAQGGILFIDEAYQLYQPQDGKDPGRFVIETLLTALADESNRDWMLILAGYSEPMMKMFEINPGLRSRIPESNIYVFDDFSEGELMEIADRYLARNHFHLTPEAGDALRRVLARDYANKGNDFGNARHVINLIQTRILSNMAMRLMSAESPSPEELSLIMASDIPQPADPVRVSRPTVGFRTLPLVS